MTTPRLFTLCLILPFAVTAAAEEDAPFISAGLIEIPENVELGAMSAVAVDSQDRIYVADRGNQRVQVFSSEGKFLAEWGGFGNPFGLIVIGSELVASEGDKHQMVHLDLASGKITATWGNPELLQLPHLMSVDSRGRLYLAEVKGKRVQVFAPRAE